VDPYGGSAGPSKLQRRKGGVEEGVARVHCTPGRARRERRGCFSDYGSMGRGTSATNSSS